MSIRRRGPTPGWWKFESNWNPTSWSRNSPICRWTSRSTSRLSPSRRRRRLVQGSDVRLRIAWRMLRYEGARGILAISGVSVAILLIFLQLGFYNLVPKSATLVYDGMQFDIALVSATYVFQANSRTFPRRLLYQSLSLP